MARVSVIVAARDAAATLPATLASLAAQSYRDWELVLVDDGSTDETGEIATRFAGGPARLVRREESGGPASARNLAVANAGGELLALLDSDDRWEPGRLERQVERYDRAVADGRRVGLVASDARLISPEGREEPDTWAARVGDVEPATLARMLANNRICAATVLMPVGVFRELGGFDEAIWRGEDYDLWLRLLEAGYEIVALPEPLAIYRFSAGGLTAAAAQTAASTRAVYEGALARGRLGARERRIARRQIRMFTLLEARARAAAGESHSRLRLLALTARVAIEHPERWLQWLRHGPRAAGAGRHA